MMKRLILLFLCLALSISAFGALADVPETVDGRLSEGEYASLSVTLENSEQLIVRGGQSG